MLFWLHLAAPFNLLGRTVKNHPQDSSGFLPLKASPRKAFASSSTLFPAIAQHLISKESSGIPWSFLAPGNSMRQRRTSSRFKGLNLCCGLVVVCSSLFSSILISSILGRCCNVASPLRERCLLFLDLSVDESEGYWCSSQSCGKYPLLSLSKRFRLRSSPRDASACSIVQRTLKAIAITDGNRPPFRRAKVSIFTQNLNSSPGSIWTLWLSIELV